MQEGGLFFLQKERHPSDASPYHIRMRMRGITTQFLTYVSNSYISIVHFLALLQTIPQLRWGIVLLQKRNMKRSRRTEIASGGRYEE